MTALWYMCPQSNVAALETVGLEVMRFFSIRDLKTFLKKLGGYQNSGEIREITVESGQDALAFIRQKKRRRLKGFLKADGKLPIEYVLEAMPQRMSVIGKTSQYAKTVETNLEAALAQDFSTGILRLK